MKRPCYLLIVVFMLLSLTSGNAYSFDLLGLQPVAPYGVFSTFSTESMPQHKFAFEVGGEVSSDPDFYRLHTRAAYGITDKMEFNVTIPLVIDFKDETDGFEDISLGLKHRFFDEGKYGPSIAYLIHVALPSGKDEFSTDGRLGVGLIISKRISPFSGHINVLYAEAGTGELDEEFTVSGGIEFAAAHNVKLLGEVIARNSHYSRKSNQVEVRFGYRLQNTDSIFTTVGVGSDLKNRTPEFRFFVSVSIAPFHEKKKLKRIIEEE